MWWRGGGGRQAPALRYHINVRGNRHACHAPALRLDMLRGSRDVEEGFREGTEPLPYGSWMCCAGGRDVVERWRRETSPRPTVGFAARAEGMWWRGGGGRQAPSLRLDVLRGRKGCGGRVPGGDGAPPLRLDLLRGRKECGGEVAAGDKPPPYGWICCAGGRDVEEGLRRDTRPRPTFSLQCVRYHINV